MKFDVVVLGGGPGGYEAAIRCARYGLNTALIEARDLGGTCLNRGCIPTKALLHGAEVFQTVKASAVYGIKTGEVSLDFAKLAAHKDSVVSKLRGGIAALEKANGVTVIEGFGVLKRPDLIEVNGKEISAGKIILATGSAPMRPPIPGAASPKVLTSDEVLTSAACPESLIIIGGGVIGLEFAGLFSALGKKVTVLEMMPAILPGVDGEISARLIQVLQQKKVEIITGAKVAAIHDGDQVTVDYELGGSLKKASGECCVMSVGRRPMTADMGLEAVGIKTSKGYVDVDECLRTNIPNIYAIGDITGKVQLAHVASAQGLVAAANCAGQNKVMKYDIVPACVYTSPEIAWVGLTADEAEKRGRRVKVGRFNVAANGKAMVMGAGDGLVKLTADAQTGEILGGQIMAPRATDMIAEIAALMKCEGTVDELADTIHPHPTISETIMETAHDVEGLCGNSMPRK